MKPFAIKEDDILLTGAGTIGELLRIPKKFKEGIINQALIKIRLDKDKILVDYFINLFSDDKFRGRVVGKSHGATMKNISSIKELKSIKMPLPPLPEQQKIAEILSTIDKKLEIERKEKEKLERIKKAFMELLLTGKIRVKA